MSESNVFLQVYWVEFDRLFQAHFVANMDDFTAKSPIIYRQMSRFLWKMETFCLFTWNFEAIEWRFIYILF